MSPYWQNVVIAVAVGTALTYLTFRFVRRRSRRRSCSECRLMQAVTPTDRRRNPIPPVG